jgi:hypothetical protein
MIRTGLSHSPLQDLLGLQILGPEIDSDPAARDRTPLQVGLLQHRTDRARPPLAVSAEALGLEDFGQRGDI